MRIATTHEDCAGRGSIMAERYADATDSQGRHAEGVGEHMPGPPEQPRTPMPSSAGRARIMASIRRTDTKPEIELRRLLHARGLRFRKDFRLDVPGGRARPDIVFTKRKVAVFHDSCFWHVCPQHGRQPASNEWYWAPKLQRNVERDREQDAILQAAGWLVIRIWGHDDLTEAVDRIKTAVARR